LLVVVRCDFADDWQDGMATILAMVNAEKEGQIESKMMKARQLEEIRDAKRREAEARQAQKKSKLVRRFSLFSLSLLVDG
jgi:60S ribosomal subunit assembly/export protein LOC1